MSLRAPITTDVERAHFQKRLATTSLLIFVLATGFFIASLVAVAVFTPSSFVPWITSRGMKLQLTVTATAFLGWFMLRRTARSVATLDLVDAVGTVGLCTGWAVMIISDDDPGRSELIAVLACMTTLVARAAMLPSTPARTAVVGAVALVPMLPVTTFLYQQHASAKGPAGPTVYVAIWSCVVMACTTVISHVIYGLQLQVRKAMQLGQYRLEEKIGEGGMGTVYRASHTMLRRPTAIKLLTGSTGKAAERFEREVQITAGLTHPNTIAVYDYGRTPEGVFYYAMEYLDGISLEDLVHHDGPQPPSRVVHILLQMCGALEEAHRASLVHRDVKPANVMLTERGGVPDVVKVLDFGLVRAVDDRDDGQSGERTVVGTPHYMAPEAIVAPSTVDARADIYGMGATAYYLLTGDNVFDGGDFLAICSQHLHEAPPKPTSKRSDIPEALEAAVLACLEKKPEDRPSAASAFAEMLRACNVPEWTRAQARKWWDAEPRTKSHAVRTPASAERSGTALELGDTIAIALEDRDLKASSEARG
ncbi:MAG TPA: serine/threonine-protein kinase [Labilithrix sp.]|nr:serine/threonine-protein kinase [Labilithrix sp.]